MLVTITHVEGSKAGQTEQFEQPIIGVGRDPSNQLIFDPNVDLDVSSRHAQLLAQGDGLTVQDLGSRNGTFVNGQRIGAAPVPVDQGAQIAFGENGPKVTVQFGPSGPGKKTRMVQELQTELVGAKAATEQEQKKRSSAKKISCCIIFFLLIAGGVGGFFLWKHTANKGYKARIADFKKQIDDAKEYVQKNGLDGFAKDEWEKVADLEKSATTDETAGNWQKAADEYAAWAAAYGNASRRATEDKGRKEREDAREANDRETQIAVEKARKDAENEAARIKNDLAAAKGDSKKTLQLAAIARQSKNAEDVRTAASAIEELLAKDPNNPDLKAELDALRKRLDDLTGAGKSLDKVAKESRKAIVGIKTQTFSIPAGQREDTTQIRHVISESAGTGFFVTKDRVMTSKEVVAPHFFDPKLLATYTKWKEKNETFITKIEVSELNEKAIFTVTHGADTKDCSVVVMGPDAFGDEQKVKIPFENAEVEVAVRPHKRDDSDYAVIEVKGASCAAPLQLATKDMIKQGDRVVIMGQQKAGQNAPAGLKPGEVGLFAIVGDLKELGDKPLVSAGSFSTWLGGPALETHGKVVGVLIEPGKTSRLVGAWKTKTE